MNPNNKMYLTNQDRNASSESVSSSKKAKLSLTKQEGMPYQLAQQTSNNGDSASADPSEEAPGSESPTDVNSLYLDEIQKAASEKNYKTLLQSDIAAYNLKMNTQKYLNNSLASSGLNTQGYGTSAHTGVENTAQNLYAQNLATYNEAEQTAQTAAEERADAASTENDNQLVTYLQYSDGSDEQIAKYMGNYGYTKDKDGVWRDANGNEPSAYILSALESAKANHTTTGSEFAASVTSGKTGINNDALKAKAEEIATAYKGNAAAMSVEVAKYLTSVFGDDYSKYSSELTYMLQNSEFQEQVTDGLTVHLVNGKDDSYGAYFIYYNGSWYKTDASTFSQASDKQTIKGK